VRPQQGAGKESVSRWVLTKREKGVILFVVIVFLLGLAVKVYRDHHPPAERSQKRSHALVDFGQAKMYLAAPGSVQAHSPTFCLVDPGNYRNRPTLARSTINAGLDR
jgi:hypothetical protein